MIRLLMADDHVLLLDGLKDAFKLVPDLEVVGIAADGFELVELTHRLHPDVLLVDLDMPRLDGLSALGRLDPLPPALVVTMHAGVEQRRRARQAGAAGLLSKATPLPDLAAAVRAAAAGEDLHDPETMSEVLDRHRSPVLDPGAAALTDRERQVLATLASGVSSTDELAERLYISQKTVKNHLASIYEKLAVSDRAQAALEAIRLGIGHIPEK